MQKFFFFAALLALASCQKDPAEIQEDLCKGVICQNGGYCVNGECECPPQYTGPSCAQEVPPVKMRVAYIGITSFPPTDPNGAGWDVFDWPDVYLQISKGGVILWESGFYEDLAGPALWEANFEFSDPTATYLISVYDYDDGITADDPMGGITFTPYRPGQKFPTSYPVQCSGCTVAFELTGISYFH